MAASAALRGVRSGPSVYGGGLPNTTAFDTSPQQSPGASTLGLLYGAVNPGLGQFATVPQGNQAPPHLNSLVYPTDRGAGAFANRSLLDVGFPYQQIGTYNGGPLVTPQAVLMAQNSLRAPSTSAYLGFPGRLVL